MPVEDRARGLANDVGTGGGALGSSEDEDGSKLSLFLEILADRLTGLAVGAT